MNNNNDPMPAVSIVFPVPPPPEPRPIVYRESPSLERITNLEAEVDRLAAEVEQLKQQQSPVRRERRRWWYRRETVEVWGDDNQT